MARNQTITTAQGRNENIYISMP